MAIRRGVLAASKDRGIWLIARDDLVRWDDRTNHYVRSSLPSWEQTATLLAKYGSASPQELAELTDLHVGNVRKHLDILAKRGRAERRPDGQWVLIAQEHQGAA